MSHDYKNQRRALERISVQAMLDRDLRPDFSGAVKQQIAHLHAPNASHETGLRDLTALLWCSIDNDDSRDLDQLTVCEELGNGAIKMLVAIADVDTLVHKGSVIDQHAHANTTSVYTSARIFPMLPEQLSTNLTSLNPDAERVAMVTEMVFNADASLAGSSIYRARVHNKAKLAYDAVSAWIDDEGPLPEAAQAVAGMDAQLRTQDRLAQLLRARRYEQGALEFETFQPRAVFKGDKIVGVEQQVQNRARQLIEELMVATNACTARFLVSKGITSLRRVVRSPERWRRIVEVARHYGEHLPNDPDSGALEKFLARRRKADPLSFPDLSLVIVKLMGSGEYIVETPGASAVGHFALAERNYMHSTAPNRRYPDLVTSRLLKAALKGVHSPYTNAELGALADHCTRKEDDARKVERRVRKSEVAMLLMSHIGQKFEAIITGSSRGNTWIRTFTPPAEGRLASELPELRIGQPLKVKLVAVDVEHGYIDFVLAD